MRTALGELGDLEALQQVVEVAGLSLIEAGCAAGDTARGLAERGARVLAVEPDPVQAEKNRAAKTVPGLTFMEAPGQALPIDDGSVDGVFFSFSLHHVPAEHMDGALAEAARVVKPETGFLYVLEPMVVGSMEAVYRPVHDETPVRTVAYEALKRAAAPRFTSSTPGPTGHSMPASSGTSRACCAPRSPTSPCATATSTVCPRASSNASI